MIHVRVMTRDNQGLANVASSLATWIHHGNAPRWCSENTDIRQKITIRINDVGELSFYVLGRWNGNPEDLTDLERVLEDCDRAMIRNQNHDRWVVLTHTDQHQSYLNGRYPATIDKRYQAWRQRLGMARFEGGILHHEDRPSESPATTNYQLVRHLLQSLDVAIRNDLLRDASNVLQEFHIESFYMGEQP